MGWFMNKKMSKISFYLVLFSIVTFALFSEEPLHSEISHFSTGSNGWTGDFTDYPVGDEAFYELSWGWENLPTLITLTKDGQGGVYNKGLYLSGNNHSDDLFMFAKRQITGLKPDTYYGLFFNLLLETNVPEGQFGVGGGTGESVYVKAGASTEEPVKVEKNGQYILSIDKGDQSVGSEQAVILGDIANPNVDASHPTYQPKSLHGRNPVRAKTDSEGRLWIFVGTDSGFESTTKYYIVEVSVQLEVAPF